MAVTNLGRTYWDLTRAENGVRTYTVRYLLETDSKNLGPNQAADILPPIGSTWNIGNDVDVWAFATPHLSLTPKITDEPNFHWIAEMQYKSPEPTTGGNGQENKRCWEIDIENPLAEPDKISGSFSSGSAIATKDKDGNAIVTRSFENPEVEFEEAYAEVKVTQNRLDLEIDKLADFQNRVNNETLWGMAARTIRLSNVSWERKIFGICTYYYTRTLTFVVNYDSWDRGDIPNYCSKFISGEWDTEKDPHEFLARQTVGWDANNPDQYVKAVDPKGNSTQYYLDDFGKPTTDINYVRINYDGIDTEPIKYYKEADFLELDIPTTL